MSNNQTFPTGFFWGAATSSHQIEGGNHNDWSVWEESDLRIRDLRSRGLNPADFVSGKACNSWEMMDADVECLKKINANAYRFSLEWSRIEPEEGRFDDLAIAHYRLFIEKLRANGIEPFVTLWHWTNPVWAVEDGGWENKRIVERFARFTEYVTDKLGDQVKFWTTLNEPLMHIGHGYLSGKFPPNRKKAVFRSVKVFLNLVNAHKKAYQVIKDKYPEVQIGVAMTNGFIEPANKFNPIEVLMAKVAHYFRNDFLINRIKGFYDYIGVNYYHHDRIIWHPPFKKNLNQRVTDFGWEIYPEGIYQVLMNYKKYNSPLYILENGIADREDRQRKDFIVDHLKYIHQAISEGADARGYFYWSLLDNFEWADGFGMKFGLFEVDRKTFERKMRPSAGVYGEACKNNGIVVI